MNPADTIDFARESILLLIELAAPAMLTALVVGIVIGILQALTQIQEMTLVFVPKILAIFFVLLIALPFAGGAMATYMDNIAARIAQPGP
jgi:flagellar biosynthesis protein FliQ